MNPPADGENQAENLGCNFVTAILPTIRNSRTASQKHIKFSAKRLNSEIIYRIGYTYKFLILYFIKVLIQWNFLLGFLFEHINHCQPDETKAVVLQTQQIKPLVENRQSNWKFSTKTDDPFFLNSKIQALVCFLGF